MDKKDPFPRDTRDLLLETLAAAQATRALAIAIAEQLDLPRLMEQFQGASEALRDKELAIDHPEAYLDYLDRQCAEVQKLLAVLHSTSR